jgi:tight adherence protein C
VDLQIVPLTIGILAVLGVVGLAGGFLALRDPADLVRRLRGTLSELPSGQAPVPAAGSFGRHLGPLARLTGADAAEMSRVRVRLGWAGYRGDHAVQVFLASKVLLGAGALVAFAFLNTVRAEPLQNGVVLAIGTVGVAFFLPNLWLRSAVTARQTEIERALPDTLDLLVTCVEAGLGLDGAFQRVATELAQAWPVLAEEMNLTSLEVKAGIARTEAMRRLADRTGVADLRSLSATLNQTEMFGTSVSGALRVQADGMRVKRSHRAEEKAAMLSVKMTIPLALCILPCLFAVILGPAAVNIMNVLLKR